MFYTPTHQVREFLSGFWALKFKEMMDHWELITPSLVYLCIEQEPQNHSMADVAMDFLRWSSPASRLKQGHTEQVVPSLVQSGLEYLHWLRLHSLSVHLSHCLTSLRIRKCLFCAQKPFHVFQFVLLASCPVIECHWEESGSLFCIPSHQELTGSCTGV